jgi:hypothetical protein
MPNMSWIFTRSGQPLYKSDWSDAASIATAIEYFIDVRRRRRSRERLAAFRVERLDFRNQNQEQFFAELARRGSSLIWIVIIILVGIALALVGLGWR